MKNALIGFHSFSGNDFISPFFVKGNQLCWKTMKKDSRYIETFQPLGNSWDVTTETMDNLEYYVCLLYREKNINVNNARFEIFHKNHVNQSKVVDISLSPPCKSVLKLPYTTLHYTAQPCTALHCTALFSIKLYCQNVEIVSFIRA